MALPLSDLHSFGFAGGQVTYLFYILERSYSSIDNQPPEYVASATEFCAAPKFAPIVGTGSNETEALNRLRFHIKVFPCYFLIYMFSPHHLTTPYVLQQQLSVSGAKEPVASYRSLEHYLEVDGGTAEDCEDIIDTGHLSCTWYALQINSSRCD